MTNLRSEIIGLTYEVKQPLLNNPPPPSPLPPFALSLPPPCFAAPGSLFGRKMLPIIIVTLEIKYTPHFRDIVFACKTCTKDVLANVFKFI